MADPEPHRFTCLNRDGARETVQNMCPVTLCLGAGPWPVFIAADSIEIELDPLHNRSNDSRFQHRYGQHAAVHSEQLRAKMETEKFEIIGKHVMRDIVHACRKQYRREFVEWREIKPIGGARIEQHFNFRASCEICHGRGNAGDHNSIWSEQVTMRMLDG